jgi:hypothetical protein
MAGTKDLLENLLGMLQHLLAGLESFPFHFWEEIEVALLGRYPVL